jgi:hypothetical protein
MRGLNNRLETINIAIHAVDRHTNGGGGAMIHTLTRCTRIVVIYVYPIEF